MTNAITLLAAGAEGEESQNPLLPATYDIVWSIVCVVIIGFLFTMFEMLVIFLQAYIFALLTAIYIDLSLHADSH